MPTRRRPPRVVLLATVLFGLVAAMWSVAVPAFRAPDEAAHLDLVLHLAEGNGYPRFDGRFIGEAMRYDTDRHIVDLHVPWPRFDAADAPARGDRPDVDDLGGTTPDADVRWIDERRAGYPYVYNQMPQHPPLYYMAAASVLRVERWLLPGDERTGLDRELGLLRLFGVLLVTPVPVLAWAVVTRLGGGERAAAVAAFLPLGLPQLTYVGAAVSNDTLLTLLGAVLAVLLVGVARGRRRRRTDVAVGVVFGLTLLTKAFAVMFGPWVLVAYALGARASGRRRSSTWGALVAGAVALAVGGWWWIGNWLREGEPAPTTETLTRTTDRRAPGFSADAVTFLWTFTGRLVARTWAWIGYGIPKAGLPAGVVAALTLATVAAVLMAARAARPGLAAPQRGGPRRVDLALAWLPTALIALFVARRAWGLWLTTGHFAFTQGRYLLAALVGPMAVVAIGTARACGRRAVPVVLGLGVVLQVWMLMAVVRLAWTGTEPLGALRGLLAWSPWPPALVGAVAAAAVATVVAIAVTEVRRPAGAGPRRPPSDPSSGPPSDPSTGAGPAADGPALARHR